LKGRKKLKVYASMIVGKRKEIYLESCINSITDAVDEIIINDNSGMERSENREIIEGTRLFAENRVVIIPSTFKGFGYCRNIPLSYIKENNKGEECWILRLDADEVHTPDLSHFTRSVLPHVPSTIGGLDAYYYKFMSSLDIVVFVERRHQWLVRCAPELKWEGDVHERFVGVTGKQMAIPYVYFDYSYVLGDVMLEKTKFYETLGDRAYSREELEALDPASYLNHEARRAFLFRGEQTPFARQIAEELRTIKKEDFERFNRLCLDYLKNPCNWLKSKLRAANLKLRILWRMAQCAFAFNNKAAVTGMLLKIARQSNARY
jgi:hypothetical protein